MILKVFSDSKTIFSLARDLGVAKIGPTVTVTTASTTTPPWQTPL